VQSGYGREAITFDKAQAWLADFLRAHNKRVTLSEITQRVAQHFGVTPRDLASACRRREYVRPRQVAMYLSRVMTPRSFPEIGKHFAKDHTTVMHGCDKVRELCDSDPRFKAEVETIQRSIRDFDNDPGDNNPKT
jgi:chromosomal replication initiator protein